MQGMYTVAILIWCNDIHYLRVADSVNIGSDSTSMPYE